MSYQVSESIQKRFDELLAMSQVQEALAFIERDHENCVADQKEFCLTESPTFHEEERARRYMEKLRAIGGIEQLEMDEMNNVTGFIPGTEEGFVLTEAHMDTVFPFGTTKEIREDGDMLYAPGIYDNARGMACVLSAIRGLKHSGLKTRKTLIVGGTAREEADGGLGGMKALIARFPNLDANVSVDGGFMEALTFNATYNHIMKYTFKGIGGHAFSAYGVVANPLGAAARAVAKLNDLRLPALPRTTCSATKLNTSASSGITSIPDSCELYVNFRSNGAEEFAVLEKQVAECIRAACEEESARWGKDTITCEAELLGDLPGGVQDEHMPLVEATWLAATKLYDGVILRAGGNTNSNIPISKGIPAVTIGGSEKNWGAHSLGEKFCTAGAYRCPQGVLLVLLMALGVEGGITSCLEG